ncbi:MAG: tRNA (N6-threonylcarbamoyladenosine(37)-N6)-methyltransferase TrmO [Christensenellales bacterium]|nr:tRNA (N6-threonylcarbamoyladenosine(37)-N6)-methyltransferase TrmO [Christensenellales bacterium]
MKIIARIHSDFKEKFGIPRQSGLVPQTRAAIVFEPPYRCADALRGLEGYSHLWLIWSFSKAERDGWSPTVRPPRLGGNTRMGVFATRSPFRPNAIGLSCVTIEEIRLHTPEGPVIIVGGADLLDGTPIYDVKPYLPHIDSHPDARGGFAEAQKDYALTVDFPETLLMQIEESKREALLGVLAGDPRPSYQNDPERIYGVRFACYNVQFTVSSGTLTVVNVQRIEE